jgi:hypothetical protein
MPEYLTQRNGHWQFVRRVPLEFSKLDKRVIIKHSTGVSVAKDRRGLKAGKVADTMNRDLESYWFGLVEGKAQEAADIYVEARRRAKVLGFDYIEIGQLTSRSTLEVLQRLEKLVDNGLVEDKGARAALLGTEKKPSVRLSEVFPEFEHQTRLDVRDMSPNQLKRWKNGYILAITDFIDVVGDKGLDNLTHSDIRDYVEWLEGRVEEGELVAKSANKLIGQNSKMLKAINLKLRLGLPDFFAGQRLQGGKYVQRPSFPIDFVQNNILADGALMGLNEKARRVLLLMADTGLRLTEAANLNKGTIHLDCDIPYIEVLPDGRRVKTEDSIRQIPLVGTALAAMKLQPQGFPRYVDKGASLSALVNKYLLEKGLRPTLKHSAYSLRHTFKDRLTAAKCQDSMIESLMGNSDDHPKYGAGPALDLKLEVLQAISFTPPATL